MRAAAPHVDVGHPLRPIFGLRRRSHRGTAVKVRLGEVVEVDRAARDVVLADGIRIAYDHLVVAAGGRRPSPLRCAITSCASSSWRLRGTVVRSRITRRTATTTTGS